MPVVQISCIGCHEKLLISEHCGFFLALYKEQSYNSGMNLEEEFKNKEEHLEFCQSYERYVDLKNEEFYSQEVLRKFEQEQKEAFEQLIK